jgi:hypothetical protein
MPDSGWLVVSLLGPEAEFSRGVAGLMEYLKRREQTEILKLAGSIDYDPSRDDKKAHKIDCPDSEP